MQEILLDKANLPEVSVIICSLNEEQCLPSVLSHIPDYVSEVIMVDGHSTDQTIEVAKETCPEIRIYPQPGKYKGDALRHGFRQATGEILVTLDADGTTNPEDMAQFIAPLLEGYDFVKGSRFKISRPYKMSRHRVFGNWFLKQLVNFLFGVRLTDICSGYNAFWRRSLEKVDLSGKDSDVEIRFYLRMMKAGLHWCEVGHLDEGRIAGDSKMPTWREGFNNLSIILEERFSRTDPSLDSNVKK
jgi:glycosyltransferase involved in cell wall biosynthesis